MKIRFFLLFTLLTLTSNAQINNKNNSIGFLFHLKFDLQKDEVLSRITKRTISYGLSLNYTHNSGTNIHRLEIGGNFGNYKTVTYDKNSGVNVDVFIAFTDLYSTNNRNDNTKHWFGPKLKFDLNALIPNSALRYGWDALFSLSPTYRIDFINSSEKIFSYETDLNLIGILWRPNAQGYSLKTEELMETKGIMAAFFENNRFSYFHNTLRWNNRIECNYKLDDNFLLQGIYDINYTNLKFPRRKNRLNSGIKFGLQHTF